MFAALCGLGSSRVDAARVGATSHPRYTVQDLGSVRDFKWRRLSNTGVVAGAQLSATFGEHAVIWQNDQVTDIHNTFAPGTRWDTNPPQGNLPIVLSNAKSISPSGMVAAELGVAYNYNWLNARRWQEADLGDATQHAALSPVDINDAGAIIGNSFGGVRILWKSTAGTHTVLGVPRQIADVVRINNSGTILGIWSDNQNVGGWVISPQGVYTELGTLAGGEGSAYVYDLNDAGQVVGRAWGPNGSRPFLWQDGAMQDISGPDTAQFVPYAINSSGLVAGTLGRAGLLIDGEFHDFNLLVGPGHPEFDAVLDLNDAGQVLVHAYVHADGYRHYFLLTPVPADTTAPVVTITAPADSATVPSTFTLRADIVEDTDVQWTVTLDGQETASGSTKGANAVELERALGAGTHTVSVTATDEAGNAGTDTHTFTILGDTTPGRLKVAPKKPRFKLDRRTGSFRPVTLVITNTGEGQLTGSVGEMTAPYVVTSGGGAFSLAPRSLHRVVLNFTPVQPGRYAGSLAITSDGGTKKVKFKNRIR